MTTLLTTAQVRPARIAAGTRSPQRMRGINADVRRVVRAGAGDRIPFFCECTEEGCYLPLWLTLDAYDALAAGGGFGTSASHLPAPSAIAAGF